MRSNISCDIMYFRGIFKYNILHTPDFKLTSDWIFIILDLLELSQ